MFILATSIVRNPLSTMPAFGRALNECLLLVVVLSILYSPLEWSLCKPQAYNSTVFWGRCTWKRAMSSFTSWYVALEPSIQSYKVHGALLCIATVLDPRRWRDGWYNRSMYKAVSALREFSLMGKYRNHTCDVLEQEWKAVFIKNKCSVACKLWTG